MSARFYKIRQVSTGHYLVGSGGFADYRPDGRPFRSATGAKCALSHYMRKSRSWPKIYPDPGPVEVVAFDSIEIEKEVIK